MPTKTRRRSWRDFDDFEAAQAVVETIVAAIAAARDLDRTGVQPSRWNARGFGNRLLHRLREEGEAVTVAVAADTARCLDRCIACRKGDQHRAPAWLNVHLVGDLFFHRIVKRRSPAWVEARLATVYAGGASGRQSPADVDPEGRGDGLRHPADRLRAAFLYHGDEDFLLACRILGGSDDALRRALLLPTVTAGNAVIVTLATGSKDRLRSIPFDPRGQWQAVQRKLEIIIAADKAPIVFVLDDSFWHQRLKHSVPAYLDLMQDAAEHVAPLCKVLLPQWEVGKVFGRADLATRTETMRRLRRGSERAGVPNLVLGQHERSSEGCPVSDWDSLDPRFTLSALQTGFGYEIDLAYTVGGHTYQGINDFIRENVERMAMKMPGHIVGVAEHSIPKIWSGEHWRPWRDLREAKQRGAACLAAGAAFDWNGLQRRADGGL